MKDHFFDPKDPICIIGFLLTFKYTYNINRIHEEAGKRVLSRYVTRHLQRHSIVVTCATGKFSPIAVSGRNVDIQCSKLLPLYPGVKNYLLKKFAQTDPSQNLMPLFYVISR